MASAAAIARAAGAVARARLARGAVHLLSAAEAAALKEIRDAKLYKGLPAEVVCEMVPGLRPGDIDGTCNTFEDFCRALGFSRQRVYERIQQLENFGDELARFDELGVPNRVMRLAMSAPDASKQQIIEIAKQPGTTRDSLVGTIESLARENGELARDNEHTKELLAERDNQIERGKKQLKKLQDKTHKAEQELAAYRAGRKVEKDDEDAIRALADLTTLVTCTIERIRSTKFRKEDPCGVAIAAYIERETAELVDELYKQHGAPPTSPQFKKVRDRIARMADDAVDAVSGVAALKKKSKGK